MKKIFVCMSLVTCLFVQPSYGVNNENSNNENSKFSKDNSEVFPCLSDVPEIQYFFSDGIPRSTQSEFELLPAKAEPNREFYSFESIKDKLNTLSNDQLKYDFFVKVLEKRLASPEAIEAIMREIISLKIAFDEFYRSRVYVAYINSDFAKEDTVNELLVAALSFDGYQYRWSKSKVYVVYTESKFAEEEMVNQLLADVKRFGAPDHDEKTKVYTAYIKCEFAKEEIVNEMVTDVMPPADHTHQDAKAKFYTAYIESEFAEEETVSEMVAKLKEFNFHCQDAKAKFYVAYINSDFAKEDTVNELIEEIRTFRNADEILAKLN